MEPHMVHLDIFQTPSFLLKYNWLINLKMKSRAKVFDNLRAQFLLMSAITLYLLKILLLL